jgi:hypothetical protein
MISTVIKSIVLFTFLCANEAYRGMTSLSNTERRRFHHSQVFAANDDLGGNMASQGLFSIAEILGRFSSILRVNSDENGVLSSSTSSSSRRARSLKQIAKSIKAEYEVRSEIERHDSYEHSTSLIDMIFLKTM